MGKIKKEKASKNPHEKKSRGEVSKRRKNGEKKKTSAEEGTRKYGYISANSVISMAEAAGFTGIQDDVAKNLAEDVTYRLRYIIQQCKKYMTHSRHKKLTCSDINEVFKMCDVPAVYGYNTDSALHNFIYIKEADVFVLEDNLIDLPAYALTEIMVDKRPTIRATGSWLQPEDSDSDSNPKPKSEIKTEDVMAASNGEPETMTIDDFLNLNYIFPNCENEIGSGGNDIGNSENEIGNGENVIGSGGNDIGNGENIKIMAKIPTNLIKYYGVTCNTILGRTDLKMIFQDLSSSARILPIIPCLLNFITLTLGKLKSERQIKRLIQSVEALTKNQKIDFNPYSATTRVINAMLLIVVVDKVKHDYYLRAYAARVLSLVLTKWCTRDEQRIIVIIKMGKLLSNLKVPPNVHYGAIALLTALGPEALNIGFWGLLDRHLMYLQKVKQDREQILPKDMAILEYVIMLAAVLLYRHPFPSKVGGKFNVAELDRYLYSYYGDSLCNIRLNLLENPRFLAMIRRDACPEPDEGKQSKKPCRTWKYMNTRYKPKALRITVENVFTLPNGKRRNPRIMFKFAGAIPVPEISLKRKRFHSTFSHFIAGKESEGHVVVVGKFNRFCRARPQTSVHLPVGCIYSIL